MPVTRRAGFALIELLTGLVLTGLLGIVLVRATMSLERVTRAERESAALQVAFDGGLGFLMAELAEVGQGSAGDDLRQLGTDSMSYRAVRGRAIACRVDASSIVLRLDRFASTRLPQPGRDSLLLYTGADSVNVAGAGWVALPLLGVGGARCGGLPALRLATIIDTTVVSLPALPALPPVRVFEVMQVRLYPSLGAWWLGARSESGGEFIQPLAGPFDGTGTPFTYLDSLQQPTFTPAAVESVRLRLSGRWSGWPGAGSTRSDSAGQTLSPRNHGP